jgi:hypothetical protein
MKEAFNVSDDLRTKYDEPTDALETPEVVALNKRERAFSAEGGFKDLVRLKIAIEDLESNFGNFRGGTNLDFPVDVIKNPRRFAHAALNFPLTGEGAYKDAGDIPEDALQTAVKTFLEEYKRSILDIVEADIQTIRRYSSSANSQALDVIENYLDEAKEKALDGKWEEHSKALAQAKDTLIGIGRVVRLSCGAQHENDDTRKILNASPRK